MPRADWTPLDLTRPLRHARELAGLTQAQAAEALGLDPTPGGLSTVTSPEQRERGGALPQLRTLLDRCAAYGLEVEVRVRRKK